MYSLLRKYQPVSTTGALVHSYYWLTSSSGDKIYKNPRFKVPETADPALQDGIAIVMVPGTADYTGGIGKFGKRLIQQGLPGIISSVTIISFEDRFQGKSIEDQADQIIKKMKEYGYTNVVLFGHSRGGLNAQNVDNKAAKENIKVHAVVNICSPYQGSYLALKPLTYFSSSVSEMEVGSHYLEEAGKEVLQSEARYYFFAAEGDCIVSPKACYVLEYVKKNPDSLILLDRHGHLSILSSDRLVKHCRRILFAMCKSLLEETKLELAELPEKNKEETEAQVISGEKEALEEGDFHCSL